MFWGVIEMKKYLFFIALFFNSNSFAFDFIDATDKNDGMGVCKTNQPSMAGDFQESYSKCLEYIGAWASVYDWSLSPDNVPYDKEKRQAVTINFCTSAGCYYGGATFVPLSNLSVCEDSAFPYISGKFCYKEVTICSDGYHALKSGEPTSAETCSRITPTINLEH